MAIDTAAKRASALAVRARLPWLRRLSVPIPSGAVTTQDRQHLGLNYIGILAASAYDAEDIFNRFCKSLQAWAAADASLVSLTGHSVSDQRIIVQSGDDLVGIPCLLLDLESLELFLPDNDELWQCTIRCSALSSTRVAALNIVNAVYTLASQNTSTYKDASFAANGITTKSISPFEMDRHGQAGFTIESIRHTERSDITIPERYVAQIKIKIVWKDDV